MYVRTVHEAVIISMYCTSAHLYDIVEPATNRTTCAKTECRFDCRKTTEKRKCFLCNSSKNTCLSMITLPRLGWYVTKPQSHFCSSVPMVYYSFLLHLLVSGLIGSHLSSSQISPSPASKNPISAQFILTDSRCKRCGLHNKNLFTQHSTTQQMASKP